jgi:hypothetical protein
MDVTAQILEWLRSGRDDANDIVDLPWDLKEVDKNTYVASHPRMPFNLLVTFDDAFVHLMAPFGLETYSMDNSEKVKVYHTLLRLNGEMPLMKFLLAGMDDEVYLGVDLDLKSLSKDEFNDALSALLFGILTAVSELGLEEEFQRSLQERIVAMVYERLQQGATKKQILDFLVSRVGMDRKDAESLLNQITSGETDRGYF